MWSHLTHTTHPNTNIDNINILTTYSASLEGQWAPPHHKSCSGMTRCDKSPRCWSGPQITQIPNWQSSVECARTSWIHGDPTAQPSGPGGSTANCPMPDTTWEPKKSFVSASMCQSYFGDTRWTSSQSMFFFFLIFFFIYINRQGWSFKIVYFSLLYLKLLFILFSHCSQTTKKPVKQDLDCKYT